MGIYSYRFIYTYILVPEIHCCVFKGWMFFMRVRTSELLCRCHGEGKVFEKRWPLDRRTWRTVVQKAPGATRKRRQETHKDEEFRSKGWETRLRVGFEWLRGNPHMLMMWSKLVIVAFVDGSHSTSTVSTCLSNFSENTPTEAKQKRRGTLKIM